MLARHRGRGAHAGFALAVLGMLACGDDRAFRDRVYPGGDSAGRAGAEGLDAAGAAGDAGDDRDPPIVELPPCIPTESSEPLRARSSVMQSGSSRPSGPASMFTSDLFGLFASHCGGCHVDQPLGGFHVSLATFPAVVTRKALDRLTSDDPSFVMPPMSGPFSERGEGDALVELAGLLRAWLAAGSPADAFELPATAPRGQSQHSYLMSAEVAGQLTNLGSCTPPPQMIAIEHEESDRLDAMFADATTLPERLEQTDVVTFDSEDLAKRGVIAFAPAYTLWADNAKKIRYVRVPRGKTIAFDAQTQQFSIPANTRFYKTFLKPVVDLRGNASYRKMETRLIVSRPDEVKSDGSAVSRALFGTYAWNEDETEAILVRDPYRDGTPFRDRLLTYVLDEQAAEDLITQGPDDLQQALAEAGHTRTYAIPGSDRCVQCHMGAPTKSFVLGFSPLQLLRRTLDEGGVIEAAGRDELDQLQRLIDYGVISGMGSPSDVVVLEDSQGDRKPRNDHELKAQGYMLGNCAHCHNPRGFPSVIAPELRDVLDFMPSEHGGIFQFPLERFSPRIFRGVEQRVPQPYITPSLVDRSPGAKLHDEPVERGDGTNYVTKTYRQGTESRDLLAPWRSLIYRNVDTPFTYDEDYSIYPHMPMNTPGYDCRARQLLGSWMVSIPAELKPFAVGSILNAPWVYEREHPDPQPYTEVLPSDPSFSRALRVAAGRLAEYMQSPRFGDCPDPIEVDIVVPEVQQGFQVSPQPDAVYVEDAQGNVLLEYQLRTPERPHYAQTDLTEPPGDWNPRRADWYEVLVEGQHDSLQEVTKQRLPTILGARLSDELRSYVLTDIPFGLWRQKDECDYPGQQRAKDVPQAARPRWMDRVGASADQPVYSISPGAQVFTFICQNCHGPAADSKGRLAATIADITGGQTRVANLRDGLFGEQGMNREHVFSRALALDANATVDDWAARYMAFMGLGGTQRKIPAIALDTIRNVQVLGEQRRGASRINVAGDANMLAIAVALCRWALPPATTPFTDSFVLDYEATPLVDRNGDVELWETLCALDNAPLPVRIVNMFGTNESTALREDIKVYDPIGGGLRHRAKSGAVAYPPDVLVGDHEGGTALGVHEDNKAPFCIRRPAAADAEVRDQQLGIVQRIWEEHAGAGSPIPYCPDAFLADTENRVSSEEIEQWALRGAVNAGFAVFLYLDALSKGEKTSVVPIDRCEDLAP